VLRKARDLGDFKCDCPGATPEIVKINHKAEVGWSFVSPISPGFWFGGQVNLPPKSFSMSESGWQEYECVERP
jgi:hypothetical protein